MFSGRIQAVFQSQSKSAVEEALKEWIEWISVTSRAFSHSHDLQCGIWVLFRNKCGFQQGARPGRAVAGAASSTLPVALLREQGWAHELGTWRGTGRALSALCVSVSSHSTRSSSAGPAWPEGWLQSSLLCTETSLGWDSRGCTARCACRVQPFPLLSAEPQLGQQSSVLHSPNVLEPFKWFPVPKSFGCTLKIIVLLPCFSFPNKDTASLNTHLPWVHVWSFLGKHQFSFFWILRYTVWPQETMCSIKTAENAKMDVTVQSTSPSFKGCSCAVLWAANTPCAPAPVVRACACALETWEQMVLELCHTQGLHMRVLNRTNRLRRGAHAARGCLVQLCKSCFSAGKKWGFYSHPESSGTFPDTGGTPQSPGVWYEMEWCVNPKLTHHHKSIKWPLRIAQCERC